MVERPSKNQAFTGFELRKTIRLDDGSSPSWGFLFSLLVTGLAQVGLTGFQVAWRSFAWPRRNFWHVGPLSHIGADARFIWVMSSTPDWSQCV